METKTDLAYNWVMSEFFLKIIPDTSEKKTKRIEKQMKMSIKRCENKIWIEEKIEKNVYT